VTQGHIKPDNHVELNNSPRALYVGLNYSRRLMGHPSVAAGLTLH